MNIGVLGAGAWGSTLAVLLHYNGHQVTLWEYKEDYCKVLKETRVNSLYLPGLHLPEGMIITHNLEETVANKQLIVTAIPSQFLRSVLEQVSFSLCKNSVFVNVSKGIENKSLRTMSGVIQEVYPEISEEQLAILSGPSHAEEVSLRIPTTVVAASSNEDTSKLVQSAFITSYFRVYSTTDILGVELGGAFKNVIAIGAGIIDGAGFGDNTKAAIMTRGVAEITRLGLAMGAHKETFAGLSGMGDLIVTCMSRHSRNRYVGEKLGKGMKLQEILAGMTAVAEGVENSRSAKRLGDKFGIETPITTEVYRILFEDKDPIRATNDLMTRDMKVEHH